MIKQILIALITIMLCIMPIMADAPHDCDLNNDEIINYEDLGLLGLVYGQSFDYWHPCDFNRDFTIDDDDVNIFDPFYGNTLPDDPYISTTYIAGYSVQKLNLNKVMDWVNNWNCINKHESNTTVGDRYYVCKHYADDLELSYTNDYGYDNGIKNVHNIRGHRYNAIFTGDDLLIKNDWTLIDPHWDMIITLPAYWYYHSGEWVIYIDPPIGEYNGHNHWIYFNDSSPIGIYNYHPGT